MSRFALISDIHSNIQALERVFERIDELVTIDGAGIRRPLRSPATP